VSSRHFHFCIATVLRPHTEPSLLSHVCLAVFLLLRSEIPSGMCAKLRTVAASNNRDHPTRSLSSSPLQAQSTVHQVHKHC